MSTRIVEYFRQSTLSVLPKEDGKAPFNFVIFQEKIKKEYLWNGAKKDQVFSKFWIYLHFDRNICYFSKHSAHDKSRANHAVDNHAHDSRVLEDTDKVAQFLAERNFVFFLFDCALLLAFNFGTVLMEKRGDNCFLGRIKRE